MYTLAGQGVVGGWHGGCGVSGYFSFPLFIGATPQTKSYTGGKYNYSCVASDQNILDKVRITQIPRDSLLARQVLRPCVERVMLVYTQ